MNGGKLMNYIKELFRMYSKMMYILNKKQKIKCIRTFITILLGSIFEMLSISILLPFLQAIVNPVQLKQQKYISILIDFFNLDSDISLLIFLCLLIFIIYALKNLFLIYVSYVQNELSTSIHRDLATLMMRSYLKRPYSFFLDTSSADILRGVGGDISGIYNLISTSFTLLSSMITSVLIVIYLFVSDYVMTFGVILLEVACVFGITLCFKGTAARVGRKQRQATRGINRSALQVFAGIKDIIVMQRQRYFEDDFDAVVDQKRSVDLTYNVINAMPIRIIETVSIGGMMGIVCIRLVGGVEVSEFIPTLGIFAVAAFKILPYVGGISSGISSLIFYKPTLDEAYKNIYEAREFEKLVQKRESVLLEKEKGNFEHIIEVKGVFWKYENSDEIVLKNLSMQINKGESVALIGHSGAGKSTLADVILGLLQPERGSVLVDGVDIFSIPKSWAKMIGYVPQSVYLTDDTIKKNIAFGIPDEEVDEKKIWQALDQAQLGDFVRQLPLGIETCVGERGIKFSGGQRQRVAIARALYYNPEVLVLDEATSALDKGTETAVMEAVDALHGHKTLIIIAHRITTIRNCDKIYEIVDGRAIIRDKEEVMEQES